MKRKGVKAWKKWGVIGPYGLGNLLFDMEENANEARLRTGRGKDFRVIPVLITERSQP